MPSGALSEMVAGPPLTRNFCVARSEPARSSSVYSPLASFDASSASTSIRACGAPFFVSSGSVDVMSVPSSSPSLRSGQVTAIALLGTRLPSGPVIVVAP